MNTAGPFRLFHYEHSRGYIRRLFHMNTAGIKSVSCYINIAGPFRPVAYEHSRATLEIVAMLHHAAMILAIVQYLCGKKKKNKKKTVCLVCVKK